MSRKEAKPMESGKSGKSAAKPGSVDPKELAKKFKVTEVEMQAYIDRFKSMDVNGDGSLTAKELVEAMAKMNQPITHDQAVKFINQYDRNNDGEMQLEEFLTMVFRKRKWSQPNADQAALAAFKEFDKNGDGHISADELRHVVVEMGNPISHQEAEEMIKMADKDKDGNNS